ncbi:MAG TPA: hypothetical protein VLX44_22405 [Xanthobacteraceae bacterium]|nr:hypothetical protein [Xanthobacteraceae bacterium]
MPSIWPDERARCLKERVTALGRQSNIRFTFAPSGETSNIAYFPPNLSDELANSGAKGFELVRNAQDDVDVAIYTAHGSDLSPFIWSARRRKPGSLVAVWMWDNHVASLNNLKTALAADFVFPSHHYVSGYLINPVSVLGLHVPACSAQWTKADASRFFNMSIPRKDKLLVNYVDYDGSWRRPLLRAMSESLSAEADVLLMSRDDKTRYFHKPVSDRFREWAEYKASIVIPLERVLSTRVFDGLLAGHVLLVAPQVSDFDRVIPVGDQKRLGVIRLRDLEMQTIKAAAREAIDIFDKSGDAGAQFRHRYVLENHMLSNRLGTILGRMKQIATGEVSPAFVSEPGVPLGLHLVRH